MVAMAVEVKKLDPKIGDVVEIGRHRYEVSDKAGGVTLEPAITKTVGQLRAERGSRALTPEEFDEFFGEISPREG
jgi:hypothetical protein